MIAYQSVLPVFRDYLRNGDGDRSHLAGPLERFRAKAGREIGYPRDEALRCVKAIEAFSQTCSKSRLSKLAFGPGATSLTFKLEGVGVQCRLDPTITEKNKEGVLHSGGCVIFFASGAQSRKNIEERAKYVAATVHWALERNEPNIEPLPRLCLSVDVFGESVIRAPGSYDRLREKMEASCHEVKDCWDRIEPPNGTMARHGNRR